MTNDSKPQPAASVDRGALVRVLKEGWIRAMSDPGPDGQSNKINCQADALIAAGWHNQPEAVVREEDNVPDRIWANGLGVYGEYPGYGGTEYIRADLTTPSETAGDKVEALVRAGRNLMPYLRHVLRECDHSPTMPSAVDAFETALASIGGQRK